MRGRWRKRHREAIAIRRRAAGGVMARNGSLISEDIEGILRELGERMEALCGSTLLVTGASGFLCSYFVDTVAALNEMGMGQPCRVIAVDNLRTGVPERLARLQAREERLFVGAGVIERRGL